MGDQSLEKFRVEYEKLHQALKKSHESEKRLMEKCRELNAEIVANSAKVTTALKLSQEDKGTISSLKQVSQNYTQLSNNTASIQFCCVFRAKYSSHTMLHSYSIAVFSYYCTGDREAVEDGGCCTREGV